MGEIFRSRYVFKVVVVFIPVLVRQTQGQDYSWTGSSSLTPFLLPCSNASAHLEFNWTYTPAAPEPDIDWSKLNSAGSYENMASLIGGTFNINPPYTSRFIRIGATAEFALKNPTKNDEGLYRVIVTDSNAKTILGEADVKEKYVIVGKVQAQARSVGDPGFTMTCSGEDESNVAANCMELRKNNDLVSGTVKNGILSVTEKDIDNANITCSLCGTMLQCLPEPSSVICPDCQPCKKASMAFLVITVLSILIGIIAVVVVKFILKSATLRLALYIVGGVWIGFGLIGTITVLVICSQVQPEDVLPCGSMTIASASFCVITFVGGAITILLALFDVPGKTNTPPISPHPQDQPLRPRVTAISDVTSSQPVNSSSSQGRPSLGPVQSSRGPQAGNASLGDSENPESSRITSASHVNAQVNVHNEATQQGEGNQTKKQKSKKKKKKKMKVLAEIGEKPS